MVTAEISGAALHHNLAQVRHRAPNSKIMAIIKADGYGHGLLNVAQALEGADAFGVARIEEALSLRANGVNKPIVLLSGFLTADDLQGLALNCIDTLLHSREQLKLLEQLDLAQQVGIWLKVDTGLHRLGLSLDEAESCFKRLRDCHNVRQPIGVMSHLSLSEQLESETTRLQLELFNRFTADKMVLKSVASSAGVLLHPHAHHEWVRPGIMLYGISPVSDNSLSTPPYLQPVMTLKSRLIAVRSHKAGDSVGYQGIWRSPRDTHIGVVAIGYGDGYPRMAPYGTPLLLNGRHLPLVGRVSMDLVTVDLGPTTQDRVGDEVTIWGDGLPVEQVAAHMGVIPYELVAQLTARVQRVYQPASVSARDENADQSRLSICASL